MSIEWFWPMRAKQYNLHEQRQPIRAPEIGDTQKIYLTIEKLFQPA